MSNPAERAARAVFDAINSADLSCLDDVVTADFVDHGSPIPLPPGPEGYRQILTFVTQVLKVHYDIEELFSTDDRIVIRATGHGVGVEHIHGPGKRRQWTSSRSTTCERRRDLVSTACGAVQAVGRATRWLPTRARPRAAAANSAAKCAVTPRNGAIPGGLLQCT